MPKRPFEQVTVANLSLIFPGDSIEILDVTRILSFLTQEFGEVSNKKKLKEPALPGFLQLLFHANPKKNSQHTGVIALPTQTMHKKQGRFLKITIS